MGMETLEVLSANQEIPISTQYNIFLIIIIIIINIDISLFQQDNMCTHG